jgi:hypothetical protein
MSNTHTEIPAPVEQTPSAPLASQSTVTPTSNGLVGDIMTSIGDFVGVIIGFGFVTIGIIILIQSSKKVQDVQRKVVSGAAAAVPQLAGAAIAANVATGKNPTQEHVSQVIRNPQIKRNEAIAAAKKTAAEAAAKQKAIDIAARKEANVKVVTKSAPKSKFSVPNVPDKTRLIKEPTYHEKLASSPRAERNFD